MVLVRFLRGGAVEGERLPLLAGAFLGCFLPLTLTGVSSITSGSGVDEPLKVRMCGFQKDGRKERREV